jgi:glycopeptide antibiotics resistance protein
MFLRHPRLTIATLAYLALVGWITLSPQGASPSGPLWQVALFFAHHPATEWITFNLLEFAANIAMFVPIGVFLVLLFGRGRWWLAILFGVVLTLAIEYTQHFLPTRVSDLRDILANSIGVVAGTLLALLLTIRSARSRARERRAAAFAR